MKFNKFIIIFITILILASTFRIASGQSSSAFEYSLDGGVEFMHLKDGVELVGDVIIRPGNVFDAKMDADRDGFPDDQDGGFILDFDNDALIDAIDDDDDNDGIIDHPDGPDKILVNTYTWVSIYIGDEFPAPGKFQFRMRDSDNWTDLLKGKYDTWSLNFNSSTYEDGLYDLRLRWNEDLNYSNGEWKYKPNNYSYEVTVKNSFGIPMTMILIPVVVIVIAAVIILNKNRIFRIG